jgi:glucose-6-phosphate 1-dehydrogenase
MVLGDGDDFDGEAVEMVASHLPSREEMEAYERVLGDAMAGDTTHFAREDYVEEAWRIVDPILKASTPVYEYDKGTWGPAQAERGASPPEGWHDTSANPPPGFPE